MDTKVSARSIRCALLGKIYRFLYIRVSLRGAIEDCITQKSFSSRYIDLTASGLRSFFSSLILGLFKSQSAPLDRL